ncbi:hypothetical protein [Paenibacillus glycanilyticus]|uniref:hypothetical protein n=1 Tax=Paenibacillus glycanilyticus TaxID=126569 RepID=UPI00295E95D7|nr:hypothetical protein [Paenibacillus glycanilyticus]
MRARTAADAAKREPRDRADGRSAQQSHLDREGTDRSPRGQVASVPGAPRTGEFEDPYSKGSKPSIWTTLRRANVLAPRTAPARTWLQR